MRAVYELNDVIGAVCAHINLTECFPVKAAKLAKVYPWLAANLM